MSTKIFLFFVFLSFGTARIFGTTSLTKCLASKTFCKRVWNHPNVSTYTFTKGDAKDGFYFLSTLYLQSDAYPSKIYTINAHSKDFSYWQLDKLHIHQHPYRIRYPKKPCYHFDPEELPLSRCDSLEKSASSTQQSTYRCFIVFCIISVLVFLMIFFCVSEENAIESIACHSRFYP